MPREAGLQLPISDGTKQPRRLGRRSVLCLFVFLAALLAVFLEGGFVMGAGDEQGVDDERLMQLLDQGRRQLAEHDRAAVCRWIESHSPEIAHQLYSGLTTELYQKDRNVPAMLQLGICAIRFADHQATSAGNPEQKNVWLGRAKALAYNLSANAWPAWDDPGIRIDPTSADIGRDLARVNLRLAQELDRDHFVQGNAWWLLGAHELNARRWRMAREAFLQASTQFQQASRTEFKAMADGYLRIVEILEQNELGEAEQLLEKNLQQLQQSPSDDAVFFAQQLKSVLKWYRTDQARRDDSKP